jgi:hypothetical protein
VLVQIALIVFAMSAMLSLVIDVGYARVTQGQMQNAADAAALEGLRKRDIGDESLRRAAVNSLAGRVFDDDFDVTNGDPDQYGAGPIIDLTEGATSLHALQTISVPDVHVYKPDLQLNEQNQVYGDMVSGRFCYTSDPVPSEDASYELQDIVCTEPQRGSGSYARNDFNPGVPDPNAFLVRLRRSNEFQDLDGQMEPDVASSGPSLPLTFGKATTIHGDDPSSTYSVRRDGLTVRATAIAETRPAMHVGLPQANVNQPGATPFALVDTCVQGPNPAAPVTINVTINPVTGVITRRAPAAAPCAVGSVVGRFVGNPSAMSTVGTVLTASSPRLCASFNTLAGYGPVYSLMASGANRVIGFARVSLTHNPCPAGVGTPFAAAIVRAASLVAASNATASIVGGLPLPVTSQPAAVRELMSKNLVGPGRVNYAPVLVPVLAR